MNGNPLIPPKAGLGFALWSPSLPKRLIPVGWVERSETQHVRADSTQPTKNQDFHSDNKCNTVITE